MPLTFDTEYDSKVYGAIIASPKNSNFQFGSRAQQHRRSCFGIERSELPILKWRTSIKHRGRTRTKRAIPHGAKGLPGNKPDKYRPYLDYDRCGE